MEQPTNTQEYGLIETLPATKEGYSAELQRHAKVLAENRNAATYDQWRNRAFAEANLNQLLDGELSPDALPEVQRALGSFGISAAA